MHPDDITRRAGALVAEALGQPAPPDARVPFKTLAAWDSIKQVELTFLLEDEFGVRMSPKDLAAIHCLEDVVATVRRLLDETGATV